MVFSSTTFLFLFLPAVFFFYWLPDVCSKIKQLFYKKSLDCHADKSASNDGYDTKQSLADNNSLNSNLSSLTSEIDVQNQSFPQTLRNYKNLVLLFFSILFYAWGEPAFVLVMILSIIANYAFGRLIDKYRNKD